MAGTKSGGLKAAATNKERHGDDFYARIGARGGRNGHTGGFSANPELAKKAGAKGGRKSRRGHEVIQRLERDKELIVAEYCRGASIAAIAREYDVSVTPIKKLLEREDVLL